MSPNNPSITFYVFRKDGSKNPDILRYFLEDRFLTAYDAAEGFLSQPDGTKWKLILEDAVRYEITQGNNNCKCLVSFQLRRSGAYAVARLWKPKPARITA